MSKTKLITIVVFISLGSLFLFVPKSSNTFINSLVYQQVKVKNKNGPIKFNLTDIKESGFSQQLAFNVLNKWHTPVYENPELLLTILNCALKDFVSLEKFDSVKVNELNSILKSGFAHTQKLKIFGDYPGDEPWGKVKGKPVYKKLLPSEMSAMKIYTGKITGKCTSLAYFIYSLLRVNYKDLSPDNIFLIRVKGHTFGIVKLNTKIYLFNNNGIKLLKPRHLEEVNKRNYFMLFNEEVFFRGSYTIPREIFSREEDLRKVFIEHSKSLKNIQVTINPDLVDLGIQTASSSNIKYFIDASLETAVVKSLVQEIDTVNDIVSWISENISNNSIFSQPQNRVMTPEQVVMFKQGTSLDRSILFATILRAKSMNGEIHVENNNAYVTTNGKCFEMTDMKEIENILYLPEVKILF